jgi:hypothetical protein
VYLTETLAKVRSIGSSFSYTYQDLRRAAMVPNVSIDTRRADACRQIHERTVEIFAAYGDSLNGLPGFVNNSAIGSITGLAGGWSTATGEVILSDMHAISRFIFLNSNTVHRADTMLLPTPEWALVTTKPYSSLVPKTVLDVFLENDPYIKTVDQWLLLNAANSNPDGRGARLSYNRIICYSRDPQYITCEIPQEFEQLPPQLEGMEFKIPCHSRFGGVSVPYPLAHGYADDML